MALVSRLVWMGSPGTAVFDVLWWYCGSLGRLAGGTVSGGLVKPRFLTKQLLFCLQWCKHLVNAGNSLPLFMMGAPIVCVCVCVLPLCIVLSARCTSLSDPLL